MEGEGLERITVAVYGLAQGGDSIAVQHALLLVPGVDRAYVNATTEMAYIEYDPVRTRHAHLVRAIEDAGFKAGELNVRSVGSLPRYAGSGQGTPAHSQRDTHTLLPGVPPACVRVPDDDSVLAIHRAGTFTRVRGGPWRPF